MAVWPYGTQQWKSLRARILLRDRYQCQWPGRGALLRRGRGHPRSAAVDHKTPVKQDPSRAFDQSNLWSLCAAHHNSAKQAEEKRGYSTEIGLDGWPTCPNHPFNAR